MKKVWRSPLLWGCAMTLLIACNDTPTNSNISTDRPEPAAETPVNCPDSDPEAQKFDANAQPYLTEIFNYAPQAIDLTEDTITFQTVNHDLVFCRANREWAILLPSLPSEAENFEDFAFEELSDPPRETIDVKGQTIQYRADLSPNPFPNNDTSPETVIFELTPDGVTEPLTLDLYTVEQVRQSGLGFDLGFPIVSSVVEVDNFVIFAVTSEQGEGFNGLTTLVRYDLDTGSLEKTQPINLIGEQITDMLTTTNGNETILWLGTKYSVEGSALVPAKGLVTYTFTADNWENGQTAAYSVHNSPLVGAIPTDLALDGESLWVATGSGICELPWQQVKDWEAWTCWEFTLEAAIPAAGVPLYGSLLGTAPLTTLAPTAATATIEVYWWASLEPLEFEEEGDRLGRFEVAYPVGLTVTVPEGGYRWEHQESTQPKSPWETDVFWPGREWHWGGDRFVRGFDEVNINFLALGASGISENGYTSAGILDVNALRGDFELVALTSSSTTVQHFSGWVEDGQIEPYFSVIPSRKTQPTAPNPIKAIAPNLEEF